MDGSSLAYEEKSCWIVSTWLSSSTTPSPFSSKPRSPPHHSQQGCKFQRLNQYKFHLRSLQNPQPFPQTMRASPFLFMVDKGQLKVGFIVFMFQVFVIGSIRGTRLRIWRIWVQLLKSNQVKAYPHLHSEVWFSFWSSFWSKKKKIPVGFHHKSHSRIERCRMGL